MTETLTASDTQRAAELYGKLKQLQEESDRLEADRAEIETRLQDIRSIQKDLASTICMNGYTHSVYELIEFEMKETHEINADRLRDEHPHIYNRANPHLSKTQIADCLIDICGGRTLAEAKIQKTRPDLYNSMAKVTKTDLKKAISRTEWDKLKDEEIIKTVHVPSGTPKLVLRGFRQALEHRKHKKLQRPEEEEDE